LRAVFNASKYPNIAAAKLATMHGCELHSDFDLFTPKLSKAYVSAIFSWEAPKAATIVEELDWRGTAVEWGGPGLSMETRRDIEDYPLEDFDCSYTSTGCIRDCPWCIVPRMWNGVRELDEWGYAPKMLDPNVLATSDEHKVKVIKKLAGRRVEWNGGIDTRLVDRKNAQFLADTSTLMIFLAWDSGDDEQPLVTALENLKAVGINPRNQVKVYILTGYECGWVSGWYRAERTKQMEATPFVMLYQPLQGEKINYPQEYINLARWCNRAQLLWAMGFEEYQRDFRSAEAIRIEI
jgi:hypothetical protein